MNEFKDLKGKPPEQIPYDSKIPTELEKVEPKKNPFELNLSFSDLWNIAWAIFSDYALSKLNATKQATIMSIRELIITFGIIVVCFLLAVWFL